MARTACVGHTREVNPSDERPRAAPAGEQAWVEAWLFDVVQADASLAMSIEMLRWPQHGRIAFHASIVRPAHDVVSLVVTDIDAPPAPSLEVRAPGLWAEVGIQTPGDHVTVDIEAFGVTLDEPADALGDAYGIRTAIGSELEWETAAPAVATSAGYDIACIAHGELLLDDATIEIDGWGWRSHRWGLPSPADRSPWRGRTPGGQFERHASPNSSQLWEVLGEAIVPDPSLDRPLRQRFVRAVGAGEMGWLRSID